MQVKGVAGSGFPSPLDHASPVETPGGKADRRPVSCREKKLLVSSEDYGRDLTGVQNLRKKHKRLEAELAAHEPAIQVRRALLAAWTVGLRGPGWPTTKSSVLIGLPEASRVFMVPHPKQGWGGGSELDAVALSWKHLEVGDLDGLYIVRACQGVLDTGKKLSDDNTIGQEEIQQRLAQFVEHWKELKQLAAAR